MLLWCFIATDFFSALDRHFYTTKLKTLKTSNKFYSQLKDLTIKLTLWFQLLIIQQLTVITVFVQDLQFTLIACKITNTWKIIDVWHIWLALYRGTINSKLTIWTFDTWVDGDMQVWHYNEGFCMERKRDLIISWRYVSLAMNRGAIKQGFTVYNIQLNRLLAFLLIMCIKIIKYEKKKLQYCEITFIHGFRG